MYPSNNNINYDMSNFYVPLAYPNQPYYGPYNSSQPYNQHSYQPSYSHQYPQSVGSSPQQPVDDYGYQASEINSQTIVTYQPAVREINAQAASRRSIFTLVGRIALTAGLASGLMLCIVGLSVRRFHPNACRVLTNLGAASAGSGVVGFAAMMAARILNNADERRRLAQLDQEQQAEEVEDGSSWVNQNAMILEIHGQRAAFSTDLLNQFADFFVERYSEFFISEGDIDEEEQKECFRQQFAGYVIDAAAGNTDLGISFVNGQVVVNMVDFAWQLAKDKVAKTIYSDRFINKDGCHRQNCYSLID